MSSKIFFRLGTQLQPLALSPRQALRLTSSPNSALFPTQTRRTFSITKMSKEQDHIDSVKTGGKEETHTGQAGTSTDRKEDEWKHREPYAVHDTERNEKFEAKWEGSCHCGKVTYQLSRDKPLASKFCHCTTCQRLHGVGSTVLAV